MAASNGIRRTIASSICAAALLPIGAGVSAQTIYKHVDLAGSITYTDRLDSAPPAQSAIAPDVEAPKAPPRIAGIASPRVAALVDANEAARRLGQAQLKRRQGAQPLPGELAKGQGAGVVNHSYWRRQEKLRQVVEEAQRRSNETRLLQLAGR